MMQLEIPTLTARAPSVKSFFEAIVSNHRKFSFVGGSTKALVHVGRPQDDGVIPTAEVVRDDSSTVSVEPVTQTTSEAEQAECLRKIVAYLETLLVDDIPEEKSCFIGSAVPGVTLEDYVDRLVRYANQWAEDTPNSSSAGVRCVFVAIEYLIRSKVRLTPRSIHRYLMTAVLLAIKYTEDFAISNKFWGDVGGCKLEDVNRMEIALCKDLEWNLRAEVSLYLSHQARFANTFSVSV